MLAKLNAKAIVYNRNLNKLLLLRRCDNDEYGAGTWENVGGNFEEGETPEEALCREVREETGITEFKIIKIAYVVMLDNEPKDLLIVYLCETETEDVKLSFEHSEYVWADEAGCRELLPKMIVEDFERNGVFEVLGGQQNGK